MPDQAASFLRLAALFSAAIQRTGTRSLHSAAIPVRAGLAGGVAPFVLAEQDASEPASSPTPVPADPPAVASGGAPVQNPQEPSEKGQSAVRSVGEQLSIGGVLGFATGYSIRKIGKAVMFVVGTEVCILQYMAYRRWLVMDWRRLVKDVAPRLDRSAWDGVLEILLYKMPFNVAFTGGLMAGLRLTAPK